MLIDLGGGSCEVTLSDQGRIREMVSLPLGAVRLQQEFLRADPPEKLDIGRLKQYIDRELKRAERKLGAPRVSLVIATSGTAAALSEASRALAAKAPVRKASGKATAAKRVASLTPRVTTAEEVRHAAGILRDRGWIKAVDVPTDRQKGGRPTELYWIHPRLIAGRAGGYR